MLKLLASTAFGFCLIAAPAAFAGERTVTLAVKNMYCAACPHTVKASLEAVPGVGKVAVSYKEKTAIVTYDDARSLRAQGRKDMMLESVLTCPHCATRKSESMPTDACRVFYQCSGCGAILRPRPGDCCVFCSYGSVPCPPIQAERAGEAGASCCSG
jgi:mercuric transport protein